MFGINLEQLITTGGILLIAAIVFAESGLLAGFFLPGDTLLLTAGVLASQHKLNLVLLLASVIVAAIIGDNVGYSIGKRAGPRIFKKKDGILFRQEHLQKAENFYEQHGGKTVIMARFIPIVRTFAPLVAGVGKMPRQRFVAFNIVGGVLWGGGITLMGYFVGGFLPPSTIEKYLLPSIILVVLVSFVPAIYHILKDKTTRDKILKYFR